MREVHRRPKLTKWPIPLPLNVEIGVCHVAGRAELHVAAAIAETGGWPLKTAAASAYIMQLPYKT